MCLAKSGESGKDCKAVVAQKDKRVIYARETPPRSYPQLQDIFPNATIGP